MGSEDPLLNEPPAAPPAGRRAEARRRVRLSRRPGPVRPVRPPATTSPPPGSTGQQSRDSALALLQDAAGEDADQTLKDEANASIQAMADYTVTEAQIENLVIAKGYADCVAFIGENALSLAVAAPEGGLTDTDTAPDRRCGPSDHRLLPPTRSKSSPWSPRRD